MADARTTPEGEIAAPTRAAPADSPVAVIDIGASAIRLVVAQIKPGERPLILEEASRGVPLGQDAFSTGRIGGSTIDAAVRALLGFRRIMDDYGVDRIRTVATSAVREAANADTFLDRVRVGTGLDIDVIDGSQESRLTYLGVTTGLPGHPALAAPHAIIVEVGGGSVGLTALERGQPAQSGVYPLGAIRLRQQFAAWHGPHDKRIRLLTRQVLNVIHEITGEISCAEASYVIALGSDMRFVASRLVETKDGHTWEVPRAAFLAFCEDIAPMDEASLVERFRLSPVDTETLVPAMLVYRHLVMATSTDVVVVPDVSLRAGLLAELSLASKDEGMGAFTAHVLTSAAALGVRYRYDEPHARAVARLAARLFDELAPQHAMQPRDRLLLQVAALLHDIGLFVNLRGHHKHSLYLLQASEIFGLSRGDMQIVANIARYHRRGLPQKAHPPYMILDADERVRVNKLAGMLRLANALDAEHLQKVEGLRLHEDDDGWVLEIEGTGDLTMERLAATARADLLTDVFGKRVTILGAGAGI